MTTIEEMAKLLSMKAPPASAKINPPEQESRAAAILSEMEDRIGFSRNESSMDYKGSQKNADYIREKIRKLYGDEEADVYIPCVQVKPKTEWLKQGFTLIEGEVPLCWIVSKRDGQFCSIPVYHMNQVEAS